MKKYEICPPNDMTSTSFLKSTDRSEWKSNLEFYFPLANLIEESPKNIMSAELKNEGTSFQFKIGSLKFILAFPYV